MDTIPTLTVQPLEETPEEIRERRDRWQACLDAFTCGVLHVMKTSDAAMNAIYSVQFALIERYEDVAVFEHQADIDTLKQWFDAFLHQVQCLRTSADMES